MTVTPAAKPFVNPGVRSKASAKAGNPIFIESRAQTFFDSLNGYDQFIVAKGIDDLRSVKYPTDGGQHSWRPMFWRVKKDPGVIGNYLIKYEVGADKVIVTDIMLNKRALLEPPKPSLEKNALFQVKRQNPERLNDKFMPDTKMDALKSAWGQASPVHSVQTTHAAVNGMLNELSKASWLMGVHLDNAYDKDKLNEYTLFHNPSEGSLPDFYESVRDQIGFTTENAKHLAAVLQQIQARGKQVKWVVHSQGGIIFKEAIRYHLQKGGGSLNKNSVIFHAGGNKKVETEMLLMKAGIQKNTPDRDNPFDLVPQLAGFNDISCSTVKRCLPFIPKVAGKDGQLETESPHTLPFISLEFYKRMLVHSGDHKRAAKIDKYMKNAGAV
jgi:hypothetical protein